MSILWWLLAASLPVPFPVITAQYDNARTGANPYEVILTPRNVNAKQFGKLFELSVDGDIFAQPLYVPRLEIPRKGLHDVVFVATGHDSVCAFDAGAASAAIAAPLWHISFIDPNKGVTAVPERSVQCGFIPGEVGITPTPVIDLAARTIYVLVRTSEHDRYYQRLHALDIATGAEKPGSPVPIRASVKSSMIFGLIPSEVSFHALLENPRAAMLLANGNIYIAWGSACDVRPYYGWVLAYDARTLKQTGVMNASPEAGESGIWQSDTGIAADAQGNVYAVTGNGRFTASERGGRDYGDSVIRLGFVNGTLSVRDYFTPFNQEDLNKNDRDLGSSGPVLLPDNLLVSAGKAGLIYLIERSRMGGFHVGSNSHALQTVQAGTGAFGAPAYWNGHLYYANREDVLEDFSVDHSRLTVPPAHRGTYKFEHPGAIPSVSSNGASDGIVWIVVAKGTRRGVDSNAILQAYDAADVSRLLYSTVSGPSVRFTMPLVAGGRVYVGVRGALMVYGLTGSH